MNVQELIGVLSCLPLRAEVRIDYLNNGEPRDSVGVESVRARLLPGPGHDVVMISAEDDRTEEATDLPKVTLHVGRSYSRCGACDENADPNEHAHLMERMQGEGCGAVFTDIASDYVGTDAAARVKAMRPDLIFEGTS